MTKSRDTIVDRSNELSLLDFPEELLHPETPGVSITSVGSENDTTTVMRKLSITCTTFYAFFKPELEKRDAKTLTTHVIGGTQKDKAAVIATAKTHPELFFIKVTVQDGAMDLEGNRRTLKDWSPYQALFGTSDVDMMGAVKKDLDAYLDTLKDGHKMAEDQIKEKFPNGFDFPESKYDFSPLVNAITNDQQLRQTGKPNQTTLDELKKFRNDFKPGVVETGHHFNMNDFIKAHAVYDANWRPWEVPQLKFFSKCVIAFLERLMTRFYLMAACQGVKRLETEPFKRCIEVDDYVHDDAVDENGERKKLTVVPLDLVPGGRLGEDFVIDTYYGRGVGGAGCAGVARSWTTMSSKYNEALRTYAPTQTNDLHNRMK